MIWWLERKLKSADAAARQEAIAALAEYPGEQVVDLLVSVLNDKNWQVRCLAIAALAKCHQIKALGPLIASMKRDPEQLVSVAAIEVLGAIGGASVVEPLIEALKTSRCGTPGSIEVGGFRESKSAYLQRQNQGLRVSERAAIADALGMIGDPRAVQPLVDILGQGDNEQQQAVTQALIRLRGHSAHPVMLVLRDGTGASRAAAAKTLTGMGWQPANSAQRAYYLAAIGDWAGAAKEGESAKGPLLKAFQECTVPTTKTAIAVALAQLRVPEIREMFLEEIKRCYSKESMQVAGRGLVAFGEDAVAPLVSMLQTANNLACQEAISSTLAAIGEPSVDPLIHALTTKECKQIPALIACLASLKNDRAIEPLIPLWQSSDQPTRVAAATALDQLDWKPAEPLEKARFSIAIGRWGEAVALGRIALRAFQEVIAQHNAVETATRMAKIDPSEAVVVLLPFTKDKRIAAKVVQEIASILSREINRIPTEVLEQISSLHKIVQLHQLSELNPEFLIVNPSYKDEDIERDVDCGTLQKIARQELARRGVHVK
ncbi:MAG: HEAT repeat domain-containing protein [Pirellulaceae bacterium]